MNTQELTRIEGEALADEQQQEGAQQQAAPGAAPPGANINLAAEFADFLDLMAKVGSKALAMPTIVQRFSHETNIEIAEAAIKLCDKYGIDARKWLVGEDSTLGAWLGLGFAAGIPGFMCYQDYRIANAKPVKQEGATDDSSKSSE